MQIFFYFFSFVVVVVVVIVLISSLDKWNTNLPSILGLAKAYLFFLGIESWLPHPYCLYLVQYSLCNISFQDSYFDFIASSFLVLMDLFFSAQLYMLIDEVLFHPSHHVPGTRNWHKMWPRDISKKRKGWEVSEPLHEWS